METPPCTSFPSLIPAFFSPGNQALMHPQEVCALKEATPAGCCSHGFWAPGTPVGLGEEESPMVSSLWGFLGLLQLCSVHCVLALRVQVAVCARCRLASSMWGDVWPRPWARAAFLLFLLLSLRYQVLLLAELGTAIALGLIHRAWCGNHTLGSLFLPSM